MLHLTANTCGIDDTNPDDFSIFINGVFIPVSEDVYLQVLNTFDSEEFF